MSKTLRDALELARSILTTERDVRLSPGLLWVNLEAVSELDEAIAALADQAQAEPVRQPLTPIQAVMLWGPRSDGPSNAEIATYARAVERAHGITGELAANYFAEPSNMVAAQPVAVPEGYALVPVEPTREMRKAATIEQEHHRRMSLSLFGDEPAAVIYRAMLSAAPKVQQ